jgi:chromosomal replication initiator protein
MTSIDSYWDNILNYVRQRVPQQAYDTWFLPLRPAKKGNGHHEVYCPNRFFMDWFSEHHLATLNEAGSAFFGRPTSFQLMVSLDITEPDEIFVPPSPQETDLAASLDPEITATAVARQAASGMVNLNGDYSFENFVVGSGTDLVYAAAVAVSREPGAHFNPLFIHGGVGLGKTHLMHAIGNTILTNHPTKKICYVTAEKFMNDLIYSIQQNRTPDFKLRYRSVDVLLVDDVAFLAGKESTQEEFFHTFNALYDEKKQIVLTSDRSPKEITTLEERLRSRFEWGLITDIQPPDLETRIAILQRKVQLNKIYISDDVIQYIAQNITDNIRRLEGALIRLLAFASLTARDINLEMASEVLSSFFQVDSSRPLKIADVMAVVADHFDVTVDQLKSKKRTQDLALARQVAMYIAREKIGASLNQIGHAFGKRDHSTVAHAVQKIKRLYDGEPKFKGTIKDIYANLNP